MDSPEPNYPTPNEQRIIDLEQALNDLITLKEHKDNHGKTGLYLKFKPRAWEQAIKVFNNK